MRKFQFLAILTIALMLSTLPLAMAKPLKGPLTGKNLLSNPTDPPLNEQRPKAPWIEKWYAPDGQYTNNGGFAASAPKDLIAEGTNDKLDQPTLSTLEGLKQTQTLDLTWAKQNGGTRGWTVIEINPADNFNMSTAWGDADLSNIDTYAIVVIKAPKDMTAIMSTTHDDYAQVWINGEKWYNNSQWTGHQLEVDYEVEVKLKKGGNVVLYRCGESGGSDYFNMHFDDKTLAAVDIFPNKANNQNDFFSEAAGALSVDADDKLATQWADIKRRQ